jgi:hypothetical protein
LEKIFTVYRFEATFWGIVSIYRESVSWGRFGIGVDNFAAGFGEGAEIRAGVATRILGDAGTGLRLVLCSMDADLGRIDRGGLLNKIS